MPEPHKGAQSIVNRLARIALELQAMSAEADDLARRWRDSGMDASGTVLDGRVSAVTDWIGNLRTLARAPVTNHIIDRRVPSHRGEAI